MGEVYQATDTKLKRQVAIKVLPASLAQDGERLARFQREAEVLAALNHPNIAGIYGLEDAGGTTALAMELVEGPTLADRIAQGPVPVDEALAIAKQIAEALEAAHERGIIHRDLKPANIKVRPDGTVKVLDFGLAKAMEPASAQSASARQVQTMSPTITTPAMTQAGMILGTAAYMSPEQARGKTVDRRADVWAFGCVLFEMLAGRRAFLGEDVTDTLALVVRGEPAWDALPKAVPARVRQALRSCLQKDARQRIGDAQSLRLALEGAFDVEAVAAPAKPPAAGRLWPGVSAALALAILALLVVWAPWQAAPERPLVRLEVDLGDVDLGPATNSIALSPDGTRIAYVAVPGGDGPRQLYTRRLDQPVAMALAGTDGASSPFFSPDGAWIGFVQQGQLKKISVDGGAAVTLTGAQGFGGASWGEDGDIVYSVPPTDGLRRVADGGGASEGVAALPEGYLAFTNPQVLPGGTAVLVTAARSFGQTDIEVVPLNGGERRTIVPGGAAGRYLPSGHLIYLVDTTLWAVPFDVGRLETNGSAVPLLEGVGYAPTGSALLAFSHTGTLVYRRAAAADAVARRTVEWLDASGDRSRVIEAPGGYSQVEISPDERRLVLSVQDGTANDRIMVYDLDRGGFSPLTFDDRDHAFPIWSPDGRFVVFSVLDSLLWTRADGAGQPQPLLEGSGVVLTGSMSPDGRMAFAKIGEATDLWTVPVTVEGDGLQVGEPAAFLATRFTEAVPRFSRDGRWLAYQSNESGRLEVNVRAFPPPATGPGARSSVSTDGGAAPIWSRTTDELFFRAPDGAIMVASYRVNGDNFVADRPRVWAALDGDLQGATFWDMASDGRALITVPVSSGETAAAPEPQHTVVFLQNFFDELRRRVPGE